MAFNQIPLDAGLGFSKHSELVVGRVRNIVLSQYTDNGKTKNPEYKAPADIGKIRYDVVYQNKQVLRGDAAARPAWPMFSFIQQYPVIGELVLIILGPTREMNENRSAQQAFYFPPFSVWNSVNHNAFPELSEYADFVKRYYQKPNYQYSETGSLPELPKGRYFLEKPIKNLQPFEGDTIIQGRFGQSIRFGSTTTLKKQENDWSSLGNDGDPITIIRNGQRKDNIIREANQQDVRAKSLPDQSIVENLNKDDSSIYLTSGQIIQIDSLLERFPMASYNKEQKNKAQTKVIDSQQNPSLNESRSARENDRR